MGREKEASKNAKQRIVIKRQNEESKIKSYRPIPEVSVFELFRASRVKHKSVFEKLFLSIWIMKYTFPAFSWNRFLCLKKEKIRCSKAMVPPASLPYFSLFSGCWEKT